MKMNSLLMGCLLFCSIIAQANAVADNTPGQLVAEQKRTVAKQLAEEKRTKAEEARARHQARHEEERAAGKSIPPAKKRYSLY